ncbi:hypothetical protein EDD86DRAFT_219758 [Gorgonomyces haynaldii]|nr:hypothetical protein EDD86DRAFT_219758 [Gorgonomyces haynaldii]
METEEMQESALQETERLYLETDAFDVDPVETVQVEPEPVKQETQEIKALPFNQLNLSTQSPRQSRRKELDALVVDNTDMMMMESIYCYSGTASIGHVSTELDFAKRSISSNLETPKRDPDRETIETRKSDSDRSAVSQAMSWFSTQQPKGSVLALVTSEGGSFLMASDKRNEDFHDLFPEVDKEDPLVDDYTCAWLKDILVHGRLYITKSRLCFHSKIIWTYKVIIPFDDILVVEKKTVAGFFQNAIEIQCQDTKHFFGSFLYRESAFTTITKMAASHPDNSVSFVDASDLTLHDQTKTSEEVFQKTPRRHLHRSRSFGDANLRPRTPSRPVSILHDDEDLGLAILASPARGPPLEDPELLNHVVLQTKGITTQVKDNLLNRPLIQQRPKTQSNLKSKPHACDPLSIFLVKRDFPMPLDQVWEHIFGHDSALHGFSQRFWKDNQKHWGISVEEPGASRRVEYMVPLTNPLGPKQTRCWINQTVKKKGNGYLCINAAHETPDVPSGNAFVVNVLICLVQTDNSLPNPLGSKVDQLMVVAIERAVPDSMKKYYTDLADALEKHEPSSKPQQAPPTPTQPQPILPQDPMQQAMQFIANTNTGLALILLVVFLIGFHLFSLFYLIKLYIQVDELTQTIRNIKNLPLLKHQEL